MSGVKWPSFGWLKGHLEEARSYIYIYSVYISDYINVDYIYLLHVWHCYRYAIGKPPRQVSENFHREKRAAPKKGELVETEDGMEGIDETSGQNFIENQCKQLICCYVFLGLFFFDIDSCVGWKSISEFTHCWLVWMWYIASVKRQISQR